MPTQTIYLDASKKQVDTAARGVFVITREVDEDGDLITERFGTLSEGEDEEDEEDEAKAAPQQRASAFSEEAKSRLWKAADAIATAHEAKLAGAARDRFAVDERQVLALLSGEKAAALQRKASVDYVLVTDKVKEYLLSQAPDAWRAAFVPLLRAVVEAQGERLRQDFGLQFDVRNVFAESFWTEYELTFAQPIAETTRDTLTALLLQAQREGWSIPETQKHLEAVFRQWAQGGQQAEDFEWFEQRLPPYRTELIARTESTRASNTGSRLLFRDAGVREKEWLATRDPRTRESHIAVDGQKRPIDAPFAVGGYEMQNPGDSSLGAPVSEIAMCRCSLLPVVLD